MKLTLKETLVVGGMIYYHPSTKRDCLVCETSHAATPDCPAVAMFVNEWNKIQGGPPQNPSDSQLAALERDYVKLWKIWKFGNIPPESVCISVGPPGGCNCEKCQRNLQAFSPDTETAYDD